MQRTSIKSLGFTLAEVLIISPIVILFIGIFIALLVNLTGESLVVREKNVAVYDTQAALDDIESSISQASEFLTQTSSNDMVSPQGKNNGTTVFSNTTANQPDALIIKSAATTTNPADPAREFIYTGAGNCNSNNPLYMYYTIYFVADDDETTAPGDLALFKRTILTKPSAGNAACSPPWQRGSCDKDFVSSNPTVCKTQDDRLVGGVKWFDVSYFNGTSSVTKSSANTATDASVSLSIEKKVAGNTIEHGAASQQVTSTNIQPGVAEPIPTITGPIAWSRNPTGPNPYNTVFQWSPVGSATNYSVRYRFNGGTWSAFQNVAQSSSPSFTVAGRARKEVPQVQVDVVTSNGNFTYGTMQASALPPWNECSLLNGWQNYQNGYNTAGFTKTTSGAVGLKGLVRWGTLSTPVCTLPAGFRPSHRLIFYAVSNAPSTGIGAARVDVYTNGDVIIHGTPSSNTEWVSLDGIIFMTPSGNPNWTNSSLGNGWYFTNYGDVNFPNLMYYKDSYGRVWVQGLATGGPQSVGINYSMPASTIPQYGPLHVPVSSDNRGSAVNVDIFTENSVQYSRILSRPSSGSYVSTQMLYYATGGLNPLGLVNGWAAYDTYWSQPRCYKAADDIVVMQGLIRSGNTAIGAQISHADYCGSNAKMSTGMTAILPAWRNWESPGRVDLYGAPTNNGTLVGINTDAGWTSLDGVHYIAD